MSFGNGRILASIILDGEVRIAANVKRCVLPLAHSSNPEVRVRKKNQRKSDTSENA